MTRSTLRRPATCARACSQKLASFWFSARAFSAFFASSARSDLPLLEIGFPVGEVLDRVRVGAAAAAPTTSVFTFPGGG